jgi:predicted secreted hydrolase
VAQRLRIDGRVLELQPLFDDQELVMRGVTYWEGAILVTEHGQRVGRGYLELTGYAGRVRL